MEQLGLSRGGVKPSGSILFSLLQYVVLYGVYKALNDLKEKMSLLLWASVYLTQTTIQFEGKAVRRDVSRPTVFQER